MTAPVQPAQEPEHFDIDLGDGHWLSWTAWKPDRVLNPQYSALPDCEKIGAFVTHLCDKTETGLHEGAIMFHCPQRDFAFPKTAAWNVECWEPLTLSPSLLCSCGDHGFIRNGKWVRA